MVCTICTNSLPRLGPKCRHCALPLVDNSCAMCGNCIKLKQPPYIDCIYTAYCFTEPLRSLLHQYKYRAGLFMQDFLVKLILDALPQEQIATECLVPIPLHKKRLKARGFNQAAELTKSLAKHLQLPYQLDLCKKIVHTPTQVSLSHTARSKNLHATFIAQSCHYKHITLIDDLITTGSTVNEVAKMFKQNGVKYVDVWCCARTLPQ